MTLAELRQICVDNFPTSQSRPIIMAGMENLLAELTKNGISADVWVDGSFLTEKIEPGDVDLVFSIAADVYDNGTPQRRQILDMINSQGSMMKQHYHCHTFGFIEYPIGHRYHGVSLRSTKYWIHQFGFSRRMEIKGMPLLRIPEVI